MYIFYTNSVYDEKMWPPIIIIKSIYFRVSSCSLKAET
jgi:hypothetical protein